MLLVIHPRNMTEETEYAIDQYILRGGKMIAFVDPYAYFDQQPDLQWTPAADGADSKLVGTLKPAAARKVRDAIVWLEQHAPGVKKP